MCKLDIIAGDSPVYHSQEELWHNFFFGSMYDPGYRILYLVFGAIYLMLVSMVALFAVMLLKDRIKPRKVETPAEEPDGSVHILPFLCSVLASAMLILALVIVLGTLILWLFNSGSLYLGNIPFDIVFLYVIVMAVLFSLVLRFSPRASKLFRTWNRIGRTASLAAIAVILLCFGFYWGLYWFGWTLYGINPI